MTADQIRGVWKLVPFRPFVIRTGGGEGYTVNHPEALSFSPSGRILSIWITDYDQAIIDVESITETVADPEPGS